MDNTSTNEDKENLILVTGATGNQGGNVARKLISHGHKIRIMTRNPESLAARLLANSGAEIIYGDMGNPASLNSAMRGVTGVFSVQPVDLSGGDAEKRYGFALVDAAQKADVAHFVHTSVSGTDKFPRCSKSESLINYWDEKWEIEEYVRHSGLSSWTILRPTWIMENLAEPASQNMFPNLRNGEIFTALNSSTRVDMIAADDIAAFACAAFENPDRFNGKSIDLASESLTMEEVAGILSSVIGKKVMNVSLCPAEAINRGLSARVVSSHEWMNEVGFQVDIKALKLFGVPLLTLKDWVNKNRTKITIE